MLQKVTLLLPEACKVENFKTYSFCLALKLTTVSVFRLYLDNNQSLLL